MATISNLTPYKLESAESLVRLPTSLGGHASRSTFRMRGSWATTWRGQNPKLGAAIISCASAEARADPRRPGARRDARLGCDLQRLFLHRATALSTFQSGTFVLKGSGTAQTPFVVTGLKPGDQRSAASRSPTRARCRRRCLYGRVSGALAPYLTTTVERGDLAGTTPSDGACGGFTTSGSAAPIWSGQAQCAARGMDRRDLGPPARVACGDTASYRITVCPTTPT